MEEKKLTFDTKGARFVRAEVSQDFNSGRLLVYDTMKAGDARVIEVRAPLYDAPIDDFPHGVTKMPARPI